MILKEAYRYQNFLDRLLSEAQSFLLSETFITNVKQTHHRKKTNPEAEDEVVEVKKTMVTDGLKLVSAPLFTPMQAVNFSVRVLEEKEKLSLAILAAKKTTEIDMDHTVADRKSTRLNSSHMA